MSCSLCLCLSHLQEHWSPGESESGSKDHLDIYFISRLTQSNTVPTTLNNSRNKLSWQKSGKLTGNFLACFAGTWTCVIALQAGAESTINISLFQIHSEHQVSQSPKITNIIHDEPEPQQQRQQHQQQSPPDQQLPLQQQTGIISNISQHLIIIIILTNDVSKLIRILLQSPFLASIIIQQRSLQSCPSSSTTSSVSSWTTTTSSVSTTSQTTFSPEWDIDAKFDQSPSYLKLKTFYLNTVTNSISNWRYSQKYLLKQQRAFTILPNQSKDSVLKNSQYLCYNCSFKTPALKASAPH